MHHGSRRCSKLRNHLRAAQQVVQKSLQPPSHFRQTLMHVPPTLIEHSVRMQEFRHARDEHPIIRQLMHPSSRVVGALPLTGRPDGIEKQGRFR